MSTLVEFILETRTPLQAAKELRQELTKNAELERRAHELEVQVFWLTRPAPASMPPEGILHRGLAEVMAHETKSTGSPP